MHPRPHRRRKASSRHPLTRFHRLVFPLLLAATAALHAQTEGTFSEAIEVRRINVDVVVTDAAGRLVQDLERGDFELYEDGKRVEILNFAAYREAALTAATPEPGAAVNLAASTLDSPGPVTWVIYVDSAKVSPGPRNDAARNLQRFLAEKARPTDRMLVAGFDGQALRLHTALTSDRATVESALTAMARGASDAVARRSRAQSLVQQLQAVALNLRSPGSQGGSVEQGPGNRSLADPAIEADRFWLELESFVADEAQRERGALRALDHLLGMISGLEGRVALLFVGTPVDVRPGDALVRRAQARVGSSPDAFQRLRDVEGRQVDLSAELDAIFARANASRVTVFAIDAADGREMGISAIEETGLPAINEGSRTGAGTAPATMALSELAESTGGRAFTASPGLADKLASAETELRTYYSLGYEPPRAVPGGFHRLEVRLGRPGLAARHRHGIRERNPAEVAGDAAIAALIGEPPANAFGLRVRIGEPDKAASRARRKLTPVTIEVPLGALLLLPELAAHRGQVEFTFALIDEHAGLTRTESKRLDFTIPNQRLVQALAEYITYEVELPIAKGSYRLSVVAVDRIGGEHSTVVTPFTVAARR